MRPFVLAIMLTLVLAGCTDRIRVIPAEELPTDLYGAHPSPEPSGPTTTTTIYLTKAGRLTAATRTEPLTGDRLESTMRSLLAGPTEQEAALGVGTAIPPDAAWIGGSISGPVASVNLSSGFELGAEQGVLALRVAQVVFTATDLRGVSRVRLLIDGETIDVVADDGQTRSGTVSRADYASLAPS